jgi:hypothetical protein
MFAAAVANEIGDARYPNVTLSGNAAGRAMYLFGF